MILPLGHIMFQCGYLDNCVESVCIISTGAGGIAAGIINGACKIYRQYFTAVRRPIQPQPQRIDIAAVFDDA